MKKNVKEEELKLLIKKLYSCIMHLPTQELGSIYLDIYKELLNREDFCRKDELRWTYEIIKQRLIEEGDTNV